MSPLQGLSSDINRKGEEEGGGGNEHVGEGVERNEVPYIALHRYQYPSQFLTTVSYVEQ